MVIRNRYPAHFKYPKANQPEMTFLVSGMTLPDKGLPWCSDYKNACFWQWRKFQAIHCTCSKGIDEKKYRQSAVRLFIVSLLTFRYFSTIVSIFGAGAAPFFTAPAPAPAPSKPFRRLRLRLRLRLRIPAFNIYSGVLKIVVLKGKSLKKTNVKNVKNFDIFKISKFRNSSFVALLIMRHVI